MKVSGQKEDMNSIRSEDTWEKISAIKGNSWGGEGMSEGIIIFLRKGSLLITVDNFKNHIVLAGYAILIPFNTSYHAKALEDIECISCRFNMDSLLSVDSPVNDLKSYYECIDYDFNQLVINRSLSNYLIMMDDYLSDGSFSYSFFYSKKTELFCLLFVRYSRKELAEFLYPLIGDGMEFREFVYNHFLEVKNIEALATLANYSLSGFVKRFQRYFNESPYKWMLRKKSERILLDIQSGKMSLQEVSHKYQFSMYSNFVHFCKKHLGFTPTEILRQKESFPI